jgi:hypothetical protein
MNDFTGEAVLQEHEAPSPDRSWLDQAVEMPAVPLLAQLRDRLSPAGLAQAYVVGCRCLKMIDDCKPTLQIPEGAKLPMWEDNEYDGVLKVIRDFRTLHGRFSPFANWRSSGHQEKFDEQARLMRKDGIYLGGPAKLNVIFDDEEQVTSLVRAVEYYRAAPSKRQLSGIASSLVPTCEFLPVLTTAFLPALRVGTSYKHGDQGTSQVVSAEILRPAHNKGGRSAKFRRNKQSPYFNLSPSLS